MASCGFKSKAVLQLYATIQELEVLYILLFSQLRAWARYRTGKFGSTTLSKYWHRIGDTLSFSTEKGIRLISHSKVPQVRHVKVKGDKSYFDGDILYWSTRKGTHPELPNRLAMLLKKYKGKCSECGLLFVADDLIEVDHQIAISEGGTDKFDNLQPLHRHCHDVKTARDITGTIFGADDNSRIVE